MEREEIDRLIRMILAVDPMQQGYDIIWQQIDIVEEWLKRNKSTTQPTQNAEEIADKCLKDLMVNMMFRDFDSYDEEGAIEIISKAMQEYANQQKVSDEEINCKNCYWNEIKSLAKNKRCSDCFGLRNFKLTAKQKEVSDEEICSCDCKYNKQNYTKHYCYNCNKILF